MALGAHIEQLSDTKMAVKAAKDTGFSRGQASILARDSGLAGNPIAANALISLMNPDQTYNGTKSVKNNPRKQKITVAAADS